MKPPPPKPHAWVQVTSARGPTECQWATAHLADVLATEAEAAGLTVSRLDWADGDRPGCALSVLLGLEGDGLEAFVRGWVGSVLWSARSPFRPEHKRRNWFVGVGTLAVPVALHWTERELQWETMRASGPGGQNVNKTESAVRLTHVPTGMSVVAREERSQHQNRRLALARLAALFDAQGRALLSRAATDRWAQHDDLERGNPVRTYTGPDFQRA